MTPGRMRNLRLKMRDKMWLCIPGASAIEIGLAVNAALDVILNEPTIDVATECTDPDCACWNCVVALSADIAVETARRRVTLENAETFD